MFCLSLTLVCPFALLLLMIFYLIVNVFNYIKIKWIGRVNNGEIYAPV